MMQATVSRRRSSRWGIDSISVNPDVLAPTRRIIAMMEQRVLLAAARKEGVHP